MLVHPSHREKTGTLLNALTYHLNRPVPRGGNATVKERAPVHHTAVDADRGTLVHTRVSARRDTPHIRPGLVHRLDKQTSGLIVVAKTPGAHRILSRHFLKKLVQKRYIALVEGVIKEDEGTIEAPIGRHADIKHWSVKEGGKFSQTRFWVRERHADTTLVELEPVTGRTNQLRIHCELIGHPIAGDVRRGGREFARLCLHAHNLAFPHPATGEIVKFISAVPPAFGKTAVDRR
jgi:23S rRNA pseudouridine1911/1915/1917 synthase